MDVQRIYLREDGTGKIGADAGRREDAVGRLWKFSSDCLLGIRVVIVLNGATEGAFLKPYKKIKRRLNLEITKSYEFKIRPLFQQRITRNSLKI